MQKYINKYIQNEVDNMKIDLELIYEDKYTFSLKIEAQELTINVPQLLLTEKYEIDIEIRFEVVVDCGEVSLYVDEEEINIWDEEKEKVYVAIDYNTTELYKQLNRML